MEEGYSDSFMWSLWSLDRIVSENLNYSRPHILFADFMIHSYFYCFKYEDAEISSVYVDYFNEEEPHRVADSVENFFELYLSDPQKIQIN